MCQEEIKSPMILGKQNRQADKTKQLGLQTVGRLAFLHSSKQLWKGGGGNKGVPMEGLQPIKPLTAANVVERWGGKK